ncbi:hypothetical protein BGZ59_006666 [Podila verticillata]|nr:hypothetical protein BGZ59_006666 [Podila verticillata]KFH73970.1 hypothetical protein MVEG_01183 [Podila verticillata NRRL 6337]
MHLTTEAGILEYAHSKEELRSITGLEKLTGGSANFVWRATVASPSPNVFDGAKTVVIKHAEEYVASYKEMKLDTIRMEYEDRVLHIVHKASTQPGENIATHKVHVPKVYFFDPVNHVTVQEDGGSAPHLKDYISSLKEAPSKELTTAIGSSLGEFIARLHLYGHKHRNELYTKEQMENPMALDLSRLVLYDNMPKVAKDQHKLSEEDVALVTKAAEWGGKRLMTEPETLAHGDFWPGNILVKTKTNEATGATDLEQVYVIDWELARYAPAAMDLGQLLAECNTLHMYRQPCPELQTSILEAYCKTYGDKLTVQDLKTAAIHIGGHLLVWAPYTGWFDRNDLEKRKEVVSLGLEYIRHAWAEDWAWFRDNTSLKVMIDHLKL